MFERFTVPARHVVRYSHDEATALGHHYLGTEHLLLGLLHQDPQDPDAGDPDAGMASGLLGAAGLTLDGTRAEVRRLVGPGSQPLGEADAEALQGIGIDLDVVRAKVEEAFGPGALDPPPPTRRRRLFGRPKVASTPTGQSPTRQSPGQQPPSNQSYASHDSSFTDRVLFTDRSSLSDRLPFTNHLPFTNQAKKVLALAVREAIHRHDGHIGTGHLLLGLIREADGLAAKILNDARVDLPALRQQVLSRLNQSS